MSLATNQRAQRRDRTNDCMCHLDHLLQLPWARRLRVPPTEAARLKLALRMTSIAARVKQRRSIASCVVPATNDWIPMAMLEAEKAQRGRV
jgi:hypothetical protein